jgi:hypothetical protein
MGGDALFLASPRTPVGCENRIRKPHKMGRTRAVLGDAGQGYASFQQKPNLWFIKS